MRLRFLMMVFVGCGGASVNDQAVVSIADSAAQRRAGEQAAGDQRTDCGDPVAQDQSTSGGQRISTWQPCFDASDEEASEQRFVIPPPQGDVAADERDRQRDIDQRLAQAENVACLGVPMRERTHSPFSHRKSIEKVDPIREDDRLVGVRVVFKPVRGLTADWMRRDIACHRARWEAVEGDIGVLGMSADPTLLEGAEVTVSEHNGRVEVIVTTQTADEAEVALDRARGQLGTQRADR